MKISQDTALGHETEQQTVQRLADAWNAGADEFNQWGSLSLGEMLQFAEKSTMRPTVRANRPVDEPKNVTLRVSEQGAVRVNAAHVHREATGIVCIYVDLHSKRIETPMAGGGDNEPPCLYFTAGEHALHLDESKPRDSMTIVEFPEYVDWRVFACDGPARYTLGVVLVAPEASA